MPRHIRNIVIAALLAVLALVAGINGYVHHQFKTNIDGTLRLIQPLAQIKYSDLSTSIFSGNVELKNVRISAAFLPETLTLGDITFETPGYAYMLQGPDKLNQGELPNHLGFAINNFYLDLTGETGEWLDQLVKRMQPLYANERKICAGKSVFGPADYKEMGYTRLLSNMRMAYDFNESNKTLDIKVSAGTKNMGSVDASINITNIASMSSDKMMQGRVPKLTHVEINYKDQTYSPRVVKYCAALSNMKKEEFINAEVNQSDKYFYMAWGFAPGKGLRDAYKDFLLKPDVVTLTMAPENDFNPLMIAMMPAEKIFEDLNVNLKVNGLLVDDLSFTLPPAKFMADFEQQRANSLDFNSLLRGEPVKAPVKIERPRVQVKAPAKYHKISLSDAGKHIDDYVRITTKTGNKRKGQLLRMDKVNLYLQQKVSGGKFSMTVPRTKIKTIEAYFSK